MIILDGSSNSCGVAILFKKGFDCTVLSKLEDPLGRYLILKAEIKDKLYVLINIYAPNKDKDIITFLNNQRTILQNDNPEDEENIIIGIIWIKYSLRAQAVQFSKRKAKGKKDEENILKDEFNKAKQTFECDPTNKNASDFNTA